MRSSLPLAVALAALGLLALERLLQGDEQGPAWGWLVGLAVVGLAVLVLEHALAGDD